MFLISRADFWEEHAADNKFSEMNQILSNEKVKLEEVLESELVIQELVNCNQKLIDL